MSNSNDRDESGDLDLDISNATRDKILSSNTADINVKRLRNNDGTNSMRTKSPISSFPRIMQYLDCTRGNEMGKHAILRKLQLLESTCKGVSKYFKTTDVVTDEVVFEYLLLDFVSKCTERADQIEFEKHRK